MLTAGRIDSPIGPIIAAVDGDGALVYLDFVEKTGPTPAPGPAQWRGHAVVWNDAGVAHVAAEIAEYFEGRRRVFELAVAPIGEAFHQEVWRQLRAIPYGVTISYGELARRIGQPGAARAVGRANGANPIAIIIPCHRVIGADGKLTGYSGGIERKAALLALERAATPSGQETLPLGIAPERRRRTR